MATLTERLARDQRLAREWLLLENQRKLVAALNESAACSEGDDPWYDSLCVLRGRVAYELYLTCERIWGESAKEGVQGLGA